MNASGRARKLRVAVKGVNYDESKSHDRKHFRDNFRVYLRGILQLEAIALRRPEFH
jgi:hypothetical protein